MVFDFQVALLLGAVATGAVIGADRLRQKPAADSAASTAKPSLVVEYSRSFFPILLIVLLLRSFVFEPFRIPSESMMPGLIDGDFIFVDKFSYGLRLPVANATIIPVGKPARGDVIVFRSPSDPSTNLIKRLIGLPGDRIVVHRNRLFVNGSPASLRAAGTYAGDYRFDGSPLAVENFGTGDHTLMFAPDLSAAEFEGTVPAGHYFFMGDNRNDSEDSRFAKVGFVPEANLVGHARIIWLNWHPSAWRRIGTTIR